jgi:hypothetical protein
MKSKRTSPLSGAKPSTPPATGRVRRAPEVPIPPPPEAGADAPIRRKADDVRKGHQIHIRINDTQKTALTYAAAREGLELSAWVRATLLKAAGLTPK